MPCVRPASRTRDDGFRCAPPILPLMWGSDYPHPDGVWPESSKYIEEQFEGLPAEVLHKITCENAGKFYGLIN